MAQQHEPIEIAFAGNLVLHSLQRFQFTQPRCSPYFQLMVIGLFLIVSYCLQLTAQRTKSGGLEWRKKQRIN